MAVYVYKCKDCGNIFEFLKLKKDEEVICPKCRSKNVEKQITAPVGFKFIGSGFYENDYKNKGGKK